MKHLHILNFKNNRTPSSPQSKNRKWKSFLFLIGGLLLLPVLMPAQPGEAFGSFGRYYFENEAVVFVFDATVYQKMMAGSDTVAVEFADLNLYEVLKAGDTEGWEQEGWRLEKMEGSFFKLVKKLSDFKEPVKWNFRFLLKSDYYQSAEIRKKGKSSGVDRYQLENPNRPPATASDTGNAVFYLKGFEKAQKVVLSGTFNFWNEHNLLMKKVSEGWELKLQLKPGIYEYKFIVDGKWMEDPANPEKLLNEHHTYNSVLRLGKKTIFYLKGYQKASSVVLAGSFNDWKTHDLKMERTADGWMFSLDLPAGKHLYKFIVDGRWMTDPINPRTEKDPEGNVNSVLLVR